MRVLFVTSEMSDFVQTGGLAAVAAALPRALNSMADVRVIIPGYPEVLRKLQPLETVVTCEASAALPACTVLRSVTRDGLRIYVVQCAELYERRGGIYGDGNGRDWQQCDSPCGDVLVDVCCGEDKVVYAVARGGTLVIGRGESWMVRPTDLQVELSSLCWFRGRLYASSTRDVFVMESNGQFVPIVIGPDFPETCGELSTNGTVLVSAGARDVFAYDGTNWSRID